MRELWICDGISAEFIRNELNFSDVEQTGYIRKTVFQDGKQVGQENWYGITNCVREELSAQDFLDTARKHWEIENGLHHVKDRSWFEDHQYTKSPEKGGILGALRSLSLNIMRILNPPSQDRKKRKYDKSLPLQAIAHMTKPLKTLDRLIEV